MEDFKRNNVKKHYRKRIKKKFLSFTRKLYKPALAIVIFQALGIIFLTLDNTGNIKQRLPLLRKYLALSIDTYNIKDYGDYFSNLFKSFTTLENLERIDLSLSFRDKQRLDCDRKREIDCTKDGWVKAEMNSSDDIFKIKLRAKGDRNMHRINFKRMSFKVDIRGDKKFKGMEEFSIQSPIIRNYTLEAMAAKSLKKENIITPRHYYIRLFINGEYMGVRHIEETVSRELIEANQRRYGPVFSLDETISTVYEKAKFDLADKKNWGDLKLGLPAETLSVLRISKNNPSIFNKYFDVDLWAKYMAKLDSLEMLHGTVPKSVKFFLNPTTGLIEPIFFDGHYGAGLFNNYRLVDVLQTNKSLIDCRWTCENIYFYRMMFGTNSKPNKEFLVSYLNALDKYTSEEYIANSLKSDWDDLWLERGTIYREGFKRDAIMNEGIFPHIGQFNKLNKRLTNIRKDIDFSRKVDPEHSFSQKNNTIIVKNNLTRYPQIYSLFCDNKILDEFVLIKNTPKKIKLQKFSNCPKSNILYSIDRGYTKKNINLTIMDDLELFNKIEKNVIDKSKNNKIIFKKGLLELKKDKYISDAEIVFENGSNVCISNGSIFHLNNSRINMKGTLESPNVFKACGEEGGSMVIENSRVDFGSLEISKLDFPKLKLRNLYGGINFINSNIKGEKITLKNSLSEDGINFINSNININSIKFFDIKSDALDSDFSELKIGKISCNLIGNDCLDLSYSEGILDSLSATNIKDKVISLGESSSLEVNSVNAKDSAIGLVSKDLSNLKINEYYYTNVSLPVAAYIKKPEFGSPFITIDKIKPQLLNKDFIAKDANVFLSKNKIKGLKTSKEVSESLYGNLFGVKTQR